MDSITPIPPSHLTSLICDIFFAEPPGGVYYQWRTSLQDRTRLPSPELDETTNIAMISISEDSPPVLRVFCHVLGSGDNSYLAFGHIDIDVQGEDKSIVYSSASLKSAHA